FTIGLSLISALLCGLAPALQASKADVVSSLKSDGQGVIQRSRLQSAFVVAQVALSMLLVVAAGLFVGALKRMSSLPLGYDPRNVEMSTIDLLSSGRTTAQAPAFIRELSERIRALPGIQESTIAALTPLEAGNVIVDLRRPENGAPPPRLPDRTPRVSWNSVEPGYFATMKIPLLYGRDFAMSDRADSQPVAVVSEQAGRRLWPGENPIGKFLPASLGDLANNALVIGVVRDVAVLTGPQTSSAIVY